LFSVGCGFMIFFLLCSIGCGIGYGYLHRIPTEEVMARQAKRSATQNVPAPLITPTKDGFSEVW